MADNDSKRFYWLKLNKDFFHQHKMKVLKALPNGRLYALIYMELLAESTSHNGELRFSELIPYDSVTLAAVIDEDKDNLEKAIETLKKLELVEILDDQTIYLNEISKMIGSETGVAERVRKHRENKRLLQCNTNVTEVKQNCNLEIRDKSIDIRDKSKESRKIKVVKKFTPPSIEEIQSYIQEKNLNVDANKFFNYFNEGNWVDSKGNKVRNWKQKIITWDNHSKKVEPKEAIPKYEGFEF